MYYQIQDQVTKINPKKINPDILTMGIITLEELESCYARFGFSHLTLAECRNDDQHIHGTLSSYHDYLFGVIIGINPGRIVEVQDRIGVYIKKNLLLITIIEDRDDSTKMMILKMLEHLNLSKISLERLLFGFLECFINQDYTLLVGIEEEISAHEDRINECRLEKAFNHEITDIRKRLMLLDNYYQQFIAIGEELEENSADIFREEVLHLFHVFADRASRLSNNTRTLQEYCVQVREAYHAQLDYDLNKIMKLFTVVTTIFLPLTLIVGWYGMNFTSMPEIAWRYGYLYVITLSVIVAVICLIFFKKKKFM